MFERLKRALVESFVGAVALGYLLAQAVLHFANVFTSPLSGWVARKELREFGCRSTALAGISVQDALPELVRFLIILPVWYFLLRWLYFSPLKEETSEQAPHQGHAA